MGQVGGLNWLLAEVGNVPHALANNRQPMELSVAHVIHVLKQALAKTVRCFPCHSTWSFPRITTLPRSRPRTGLPNCLCQMVFQTHRKLTTVLHLGTRQWFGVPLHLKTHLLWVLIVSCLAASIIPKVLTLIQLTSWAQARQLSP